jgi:hypothetical protein
MSSEPVIAVARERAIRILTDAYAYDLITEPEFERRLGLLGLASTTASLDGIVADLPTSGSELRTTSLGYAPRARSEGRIVGFMSETCRRGPWRVPQHLTIRATMCDMKIDLRYAAIPPGCFIEVNAIMASVSLVAAPGLVVDFSVDPILGSAGSDAGGASLDRIDGAHVVVRGRAILADVRVHVRNLRR